MEAAAQFSRHCHEMPTVPSEKERLLALVYHRSLTMAKKDTRRLRRKSVKALRRGLEQSAREAPEAARAAKLKRQQDRTVQRRTGYIDSSSLSDITDGFDNPPRVADAYPNTYSSARDRKGKWPMRRW